MAPPSAQVVPGSLRILHTEAATSFGGQEQYIYRMMHIMRERGHVLEAACQPHAQLTHKLREAGFTVHTMLMDGPRNYVRSVVRLRHVLRQGEFDVVNSHSRRDTMIAAMAGRLAGTPLIVRSRHLAKRVGSLLSYTILPKRVTTPSEFVRQGLIRRGVDPDHVAVVYPVVDTPREIPVSPLRQELGLDADAVIVGCVAVMRAGKGHTTLIDAMVPLFDAYPALHLVLVGGGSPLFEQIQQRVTELGLAHRIHLLGMRRDVPSLLPGFDIFALATESEASGTAFVEASAAGLPVIGTNVDGVPEMFVDGESGILFPLRDTTALRDALRTLIDNPMLRRSMGAEGRRRYLQENRFTPTGMGDRVEACYARWLAELRR